MTIKFRGRGLKDKKLYYGSYVHTMPQSSFPAIIDNGGFYNEVDPESVAQFVGYDADGKEVYEGDICHCEELGDCFIVLLGYSVPGYLPLNSKEIEWHLKEREKNDN